MEKTLKRPTAVPLMATGFLRPRPECVQTNSQRKMSGDKICAQILSSFQKRRNEDKMCENIVRILYEFCTKVVPTSWEAQ